MGSFRIILYALVFFLILGGLNRWPAIRRHSLMYRINGIVNVLFWILLFVAAIGLIQWFFFRY